MEFIDDRNHRKIRRRLTKISLAKVVIGLTLFTFIYISLALLTQQPNPFVSPFSALPFNRHDWLGDASCVDGSNRRGLMANDLLHRHLKTGMSKKQIVTFLGSPGDQAGKAAILSNTTRFTQSDRKANSILIYYLGEEIGMFYGVDLAWLYLYLDSANRFYGGRIVQPEGHENIIQAVLSDLKRSYRAHP